MAKRLEVKAKWGDKVYIIRPDKRGVHRVYGPVYVDTVKAGDLGVAYEFVGVIDIDGERIRACYEYDVYLDKDEAVSETRAINTGLKNEEILVARCNDLWKMLQESGRTDADIFKHLSELSRKEVVTRTSKLNHDVISTGRGLQDAPDDFIT